MKNIGKKLISSVCALALVANSVAGVMAQDKKKDVPRLPAAKQVTVEVGEVEEMYKKIEELRKKVEGARKPDEQ